MSRRLLFSHVKRAIEGEVVPEPVPVLRGVVFDGQLGVAADPQHAIGQDPEALGGVARQFCASAGVFVDVSHLLLPC